jgi:nucleoside-diphosphate-sugar epimerase
MKVLVTGGAGYVGTTLVPMLLAKGHQVRVLDCLLYGADLPPDFAESARFSLVRGDIRDCAALEFAAESCDAIVHLGAIVGLGACEKNPQLAQQTNVLGSENVAAVAVGRPLVYASTGSCYGIVKDALCTEETPLHPLSVYARTKAQGEEVMLAAGATVFRIATAFGVSPRLRLDLLVNEFVHRAIHEKVLRLYEGSARRSFIDVSDIAGAICFALDHAAPMRGQVYNVGSERMNFTKMEICRMIQARVGDVRIELDPAGHDPDQRDYAIAYGKLSALGYDTKVSMEQGIDALAVALRNIPDRSRYCNARLIAANDADRKS